MTKTVVVVADGARARFFTLEAPPEHRPSDPPKLVERESLVNPERELTGSQLFSNTRSGASRAPNGRGFELDDHRDAHRQEIERRFAKRLARAVNAFLRAEPAFQVVLAIEPRLLGMLRAELGEQPFAPTKVVEVPVDLSWHPPERIQDALRSHGVRWFPAA